jgi:hypothetical protein
MRMILEDKTGQGREFRRVDRADKRDIRAKRRAKMAHQRLANAVI